MFIHTSFSQFQHFSLLFCSSTRYVRFNIDFLFFFLMIRRPPRSTHCISSAASDVYKRQGINAEYMGLFSNFQIISIFIKICFYLMYFFFLKCIFIYMYINKYLHIDKYCLLYTSPSPRDQA
eukprot:TRINITY_DN2650_c0_g1_i1.p1 TRINITY_DN2650_c0_g1~~TRINITY_DN2650_c0_g1_i1.p1  ORF type:complete len:122 (+),score=25.95 TRINITY_DN2650_c0_g1_i1:37-402(+)